MVTLAPLSLPITVKVVYNEVLVPNKVFIVVAVKLIVVPFTVLLKLVPIVSIEFKFKTSDVFIPIPVKLDKTLESAIVHTYPLFSNVFVTPK